MVTIRARKMKTIIHRVSMFSHNVKQLCNLRLIILYQMLVLCRPIVDYSREMIVIVACKVR